MIDPTRHNSVFSPEDFGDRRVDVIGCGATGSRIALSLAKLGITNLHIWDFDTIEEHNIANQIFNWEDVGCLKVDALAECILSSGGVICNSSSHNEKVDGSQELGEVVFLLTDTMSSRKEIWEGALKNKMSTELMIETRMGVNEGRVYAIEPFNPKHVERWESTLYTDDEAEVSACGASISVGPTAEIISGLAVWQLIKWFNNEQGGESDLENEVLVYTNPVSVYSTKY